MDVASPLNAGTAVQETGSLGSAAWFEWNEMATKFFGTIGQRPAGPRGLHSPMAQGEGVHR
jgi:hypothetical protein